MSDDLADYPIVVLENDSPQMEGKLGLFDFLMPVGATGIVYVAAVPGILYKQGPLFSPEVQHAARLRAASTAIQEGFMRGEFVAFMRVALQLTQAELAAEVGVTLVELQAWESNTTEIPRLHWRSIANRVMREDKRAMPLSQALCPPNYRRRKIRVFPQTPAVPIGTNTESTNDLPQPIVGPNCEPYGDPC